MSLFDVPVGKPVWDKYTQTNRAALDRALAKVRARTRSLYASSKAKFNEVVEVNERLGRAVGPDEAAGPERLAFQGMEDINVNMVRNFGEMEGITEEMAYIGARLNQIFTDNSDAIANGTYKVPEEVQDLLVKAHELAARAFAISDGVGSMAVSQKEFMETLLDTLDDTDLADITDLFNGMARGVRRSYWIDKIVRHVLPVGEIRFQTINLGCQPLNVRVTHQTSRRQPVNQTIPNIAPT